jgi:hypothetical protein
VRGLHAVSHERERGLGHDDVESALMGRVEDVLSQPDQPTSITADTRNALFAVTHPRASTNAPSGPLDHIEANVRLIGSPSTNPSASHAQAVC